MRPNSLAFRLFASAAAWTLVVLPVTAFLLLSLYRQAVERNFDARLNVYLTSLVASTTAEGAKTPTAPANLGEPAFTIPFSGWYWQIKTLDAEQPLFISDSLLDQQLKLPSQEGVTPDQTLTRRAYAPGPQDQRLRVVEREIRPAGAQSTPYSYAIAGDAAEIERDLAEFRMMLIAALGVLGLGLVVATLAPPALAIAFWFGSMRVRQGWLFHILLVPTTYAVMRGAIATMLWAAHEPDSDGLTGWATDPAMLLLLICPVVYFSTLGLMRLHRRSLTANGS